MRGWAGAAPGEAGAARLRGRWALGLYRGGGGGREDAPAAPSPSGNAGPREGHCHQGKTSAGWSSTNWLSNCVSSPPPKSLLRPPLPELAVLPAKALPLTVAVPPRLSMPPPRSAE